MYRTSQASRLERAVHPQPSTQGSFFRSAPQASTKNSAFAHVHTRSHAQPTQRTVPTAVFSSSAINSFLPRNSHHPSYRFYASSSTTSESSPNIVYATIGICCAVFLYNSHAQAELVKRKNAAPAEFLKQNLLCSTENWGAGRWWTLLLSSFNHVDVIHLGANMLSLYSLGPVFVLTFGARGFVLTWVAGAVSSCGLSLWWENQGRKIPFVAAILRRQKRSLQPVEVKYGGVLGASGSILGLSSSLMLAMPNMPVSIFPLPIPFRFWVLNSLLAVLSGCFLITDTFPSLGHAGHLGGMAGGLVCGSMLLRR